MKNRKNILLGANILFIAALMILSSVVVVANTEDNELEEPTSTKDTTYIKNPSKFEFKDAIDISSRGVKCYGCNLHNDPNFNIVWFDVEYPGTFNDIDDIISSNFLSGGCFVNDTWWACEYSEGNSLVWTINELTGDMTLVGPSGVGLNGLAYDPNTDTLYGCNSTHLFTINQENGDSNYIGPFNTDGLMIGIACDMNGTMYGEDLGTDSLYEINKTDGSATLIGALGIDINYAQDIAYDKINDILYSTGYKGSGYGGGALGTLDLTDGHYTKIGDFPIGKLGVPSEVDAFAIPYIIMVNDPPETPTITGPTSGNAGTSYDYIFNSVDPNGNEVFYYITWDDGYVEVWDGPHASGEDVVIPHTYAKQGTYTIRAKAKDIYDAESDLGELTVTMPRVKAINTPFLDLLKNHPNLFSILKILHRLAL